MGLRISPLVSSNMVVQRDKPFVITGFAESRGRIRVVFGDVSKDTVADDDGRFSVDLGTFPASNEPRDLEVYYTLPGEGSQSGRYSATNIVVGDVWLLGGQSNMQLWLSRTAHRYPEVMELTDPSLRQYSVPQTPDFAGAVAPWDAPPGNGWQPFSPATSPDFSAVGYFLASSLRERYQVPIGLLAAAVGGTPIATWLPREALERLGVDLAEADAFGDADMVAATQAADSTTEADHFRVLDAQDPGVAGKWYAPDFDDETWPTGELTDIVPGPGSYWYRRSIVVPEKLAGREAEIYLGTAVDRDEVYVNGELIGSTMYRHPPRAYQFTLPPGEVTIAIRLVMFGEIGTFAPAKARFIGTDAGTISLEGSWRMHPGAATAPAPAATNFNNIPTGLFNSMIAPLGGLGLKGVAWYQGESDSGDPGNYPARLAALITSWRELFGDDELPFVIQELAHWDGSGVFDPEHQPNWEALRAAQRSALDIPNTGVSTGYDIGEWNDLHPQGKRVVGERLARLAARLAYGESLPPNMFEQYHIANTPLNSPGGS